MDTKKIVVFEKMSRHPREIKTILFNYFYLGWVPKPCGHKPASGIFRLLTT